MRTVAWLPRTRWQWIATAAGLIALAGCLASGLADARGALLSYLAAFVFWLGLSLGSLALLLVHGLTGGAWGSAMRPALLAAARVLVLLAVLSLPILFGLHALYPWANAQALGADEQLRAQTWYLDPTFFVLRAIAYFSLWIALVIGVDRRLRDSARAVGIARIAAPGLVVLGITVTLAAIDWIMSLVPHWHSTVFGLLVASGQALSACALAVVCVALGRRRYPSRLLHDLGNLLLVLVLLWSYLAFMEYLTVWTADLPAETAWYIPRTLTSWRWLGGFLIVFRCVLPFALLLSRDAKRHRAWLGSIAAMLLVAGAADACWLVVPGLRGDGFALTLRDALAWIGIGSLWMIAFVVQLRIVGGYAVIDADALEVAQHG